MPMLIMGFPKSGAKVKKRVEWFLVFGSKYTPNHEPQTKNLISPFQPRRSPRVTTSECCEDEVVTFLQLVFPLP